MLLFQFLLFLYQPDFVIRQLLELGPPLRRVQRVVFRNIFDSPGDIAQYLLASAERALEYADADEAARVNIRIDRSRHDQVDYGDALALLALSVNAPYPLLNAHRIPRQVVVHHTIAELVVQSLATDFREQHHIETVAVFTRFLETAPQCNALLVRRPAVDHPDAHTVLCEMVVKIAKGVAKTAEQHHLVVGQALLVPNDCAERVEFWVVRIEGSALVEDGLDLRPDGIDGIA